MARFELIAAALLAALVLQGCTNIPNDENCTSPGDNVQERCAVCKDVEWATCKPGYQPVFVSKDNTGSDKCKDTVGSDLWHAYECKEAPGDHTKCTSADLQGGTDCYEVASEGEPCAEGYKGAKVGDSLGKFAKMDVYYYTCTAA
eukprot:TRINITY_DN82783_c0_g1_i1.p1 TRINITY_DN82783_c0_g1~~TRINITY_DN82783_c0_g1_i1.p1  ORF type:complete len:165 (+),score=33.98 TRINITY_DN82783_c0_g1_i1:62-496(+)